MSSFQHQIVFEFVTSTEELEGMESQGAYNRADIQKIIQFLIDGCEELKSDKIGMIEYRVTNVDTMKVDPSIRRRRGQFLNMMLNARQVMKLWNERYRHINPHNFFNSLEDNQKQMEIVNNNRHLIVSSMSGIQPGFTFSLPEADDAMMNLVWSDIREKVEDKFNNSVAEIIRTSVLSKIEGSFEDGLIERIREATINKHIEESNKLIEDLNAQINS